MQTWSPGRCGGCRICGVCYDSSYLLDVACSVVVKLTQLALKVVGASSGVGWARWGGWR